MIDTKFIDWLVDVAVTNGRLTEAERRSFYVLIERPRHAALVSNWRIIAEATAADYGGNYSQAYWQFTQQVLDPLRADLLKDVEDLEARERHAAVLDAARADAEATAAGLPTKAQREAAEIAEAVAEEKARKDSTYLSRFPAKLPEPVAGNYLRKAHEAQDTAARTRHSSRGNVVVRS